MSEFVGHPSSKVETAKKILQNERPDDWQDIWGKMEDGISRYLSDDNLDFWKNYLDLEENTEIAEILAKKRSKILGENSILSVVRKSLQE